LSKNPARCRTIRQPPENEDGIVAEDDLRNGWLMLSEHGCGYWSFLGITGKEHGKVWEEEMSADTGLRPTGQTFLQWYEVWLDNGRKDFSGGVG
jgi:hypothetical protein